MFYIVNTKSPKKNTSFLNHNIKNNKDKHTEFYHRNIEINAKFYSQNSVCFNIVIVFVKKKNSEILSGSQSE